MSKSSHIVEHFVSTSIPITFGVLKVNNLTINKACRALQNTVPTDPSVIKDLERSILTNGYNCSFPIVVNNEFKTVDGFSRLSACINLIKKKAVDELLTPFYTSVLSGEEFNCGSRGTSAEEINYLFKIPRHNGLMTGSSKRASEQAIEASQMLDMSKLDYNFDKAFRSDRVQRHTSKIVRDSEVFTDAYKAVCEVSTVLEINPDSIKWAHWLAMFCRRGISATTKAIAKQNVIEIRGTTQKQRYDSFVKCIQECDKGGL